MEKITDLIKGKISQVDIARKCNVSQQAVSLWLKENKVPAKRVKAFSKATGIPKTQLNPEVFE